LVHGRGFSRSILEVRELLTANLGAQLWQYPDDGKTAAIRLVARCASRADCSKRASIMIEGRDRIGHPIWHWEFCDEHAKPVIASARAY
jgi:hypothetical protein